MGPTTTQDFLEYYSDLLPAQYKYVQKAPATIEVLAELALMPQGGNVVTSGGAIVFSGGDVVVDSPFGEIIPLALAGAFDIKTARGQQLQYLAEPIGAKNAGYNLSGQWVVLDDDDFRLLLQAASARNSLTAKTPAIFAFIQKYFSGILRVKDELNMHMTFTYLAELGAVPWAELFISQGFLPRPLGVGFGSLIIQNNFYGWRTYKASPPSWVKPACTYSAPVASDNPVLTYSDGIPVEG